MEWAKLRTYPVEARDGSVIIAAVDGELTVKRFRHRAGRVALMPDNNRYPAIVITDQTDFKVWGVVTHVIHKPQ